MTIDYLPHSAADIPARVTWLNDLEVNRWFDDYREHGTTLAKQQAWFAGYEQDQTRDFYTIRADGSPIGVVGLTHFDLKHQQAELFIMIGDPTHRGQGIGQQAVRYMVDYAFTELGLHRVSLHVSQHNTAAINCYAKAGFIEEGRLRDDRLSAGKYEDTLVMGILNSQSLARETAPSV